MSEVRVSVVVCTRDRPTFLRNCLESVLSNGYPSLEIILVDQSLGDQSEELATMLARADSRLTYLRQDSPGKSKALNRALALATGDIFLHTDDDCTVPADWVASTVRTLQADPEAAIVFGALAAPEINWGTEYIPTFSPTGTQRFTGRGTFIRLPKIGVGANMAVRRAVYERIKGFDECLGPGCRFRSGDEWDMAYRALKAGFTALHDPSNVVLHWGKREYAGGAGRDLLRNKLYGVGAGYSKHVRCGDVVALVALLRAAGREAGYLGGNLIRHGRPSGAGRLFFMAKGVMDGLRQPIDRKTWLYQARAEEAPA